jgi:signal transduction histidine kinase
LFAGGGFTIIAFIWNKALNMEVELKTRELKESHDRLLRSERFAAVGEAAAYVSHEIKNPLMVIGGFIRQLQRHFGTSTLKLWRKSSIPSLPPRIRARGWVWR